MTKRTIPWSMPTGEEDLMDFRYLAATFLGAAMIAVPVSMRLAGGLAGACLVCAVIREYRSRRARNETGSSDDIRVGQ